MADIAQGGGGGHGDKKVRSKKASTRVDMTPMVDLGFLLITFFILATTLSKPSSMSLAVPDKQTDVKEQQSEPLKASKVLTLFLAKDNTVWALDRIAADDDKAKTDLKKVSFGPDLRTLIFQSQAQVDREHGKDDKGLSQFVVVIKPLKSSTYKNMVDALDEMAVTRSKRYALVDALTTAEKELLGDKAE
ncbi:biopolymer transporter ExbD [Runella rosea]|uniref:Biopolymer transporter ExbD n=1 Tax=Runella rosea TaxID=2259595 RepID=A0A344TKJ0_9BACT|nr:biopolymer transporter ExbD [Runella rosea]AXE19161.1 biopolymer transporter ExbD [Runella rosea]